MTTAQIAKIIESWFAHAKVGYGPLLPDGWFGGRPYESGFALKDMQVVGTDIVLEMSEDATLTLSEPQCAVIQDDALMVDGYRSAVLRWRRYGSDSYGERRYHAGQIKFLPELKYQ